MSPEELSRIRMRATEPTSKRWSAVILRARLSQARKDQAALMAEVERMHRAQMALLQAQVEFRRRAHLSEGQDYDLGAAAGIGAAIEIVTAETSSQERRS